jgi:hypothetical protein
MIREDPLNYKSILVQAYVALPEHEMLKGRAAIALGEVLRSDRPDVG